MNWADPVTGNADDTDPTAGATEMRACLDRLRNALASNVVGMSEMLGPRGTRDKARLNHLLLDTSQLVHAGHRLMADSGPLKSRDIAAAGDDRDAQSAAAQAWNRLNLAINALRLDLNKWPQVESMLRPQVRRRRQPLIEPWDSLPTTTQCRERVSDQLFAQLHHLLNQTNQDKDAHEHGCFPDIPLAQSLFLREVHAARRCLSVLKPGVQTRFLDVGCGAGLKVISAAPYFDRCVGLEYDPGYVERAKDLFIDLPHDRCRVVQGDALTWTGYDDYDVIYFFRPLRDDALLAKMESHIVEQSGKGRLLIAPYRIFETRVEDYGCAHIAGHLWLTGSTDAQAQKLRRAAELIGTDVQLQPDANVPLIWDPLIKVSRLNGFEPTLGARAPLKDTNA